MSLHHLPPHGQSMVIKECFKHEIPVGRVLSRELDKATVYLRHSLWCKLRHAGVRNHLIAKAFNVSAPAISRAYTRAGGTPVVPITALVSYQHLGSLELAAADRKIDTRDLVTSLLNVIAQDEMYDAILDDCR